MIKSFVAIFFSKFREATNTIYLQKLNIIFINISCMCSFTFHKKCSDRTLKICKFRSITKILFLDCNFKSQGIRFSYIGNGRKWKHKILIRTLKDFKVKLLHSMTLTERNPFLLKFTFLIIISKQKHTFYFISPLPHFQPAPYTQKKISDWNLHLHYLSCSKLLLSPSTYWGRRSKRKSSASHNLSSHLEVRDHCLYSPGYSQNYVMCITYGPG